MFLLIRSNLLQVSIEWVLHAGLDEVFLGVVLETLLVERGLEMLKGKSVVENVGYVRRTLENEQPVGLEVTYRR